MKNWLKETWFKILLILIVSIFAYAYIMNQRYNEYVDCQSKILGKQLAMSNSNQGVGGWNYIESWTSLCDSSLNHYKPF
jgi:hypothetical protein